LDPLLRPINHINCVLSPKGDQNLVFTQPELKAAVELSSLYVNFEPKTAILLKNSHPFTTEILPNIFAWS